MSEEISPNDRKAISFLPGCQARENRAGNALVTVGGCELCIASLGERFARPNEQAHDDLQSEFIMGSKGQLSLPQ